MLTSASRREVKLILTTAKVNQLEVKLIKGSLQGGKLTLRITKDSLQGDRLVLHTTTITARCSLHEFRLVHPSANLRYLVNPKKIRFTHLSTRVNPKMIKVFLLIMAKVNVKEVRLMQPTINLRIKANLQNKPATSLSALKVKIIQTTVNLNFHLEDKKPNTMVRLLQSLPKVVHHMVFKTPMQTKPPRESLKLSHAQVDLPLAAMPLANSTAQHCNQPNNPYPTMNM